MAIEGYSNFKPIGLERTSFGTRKDRVRYLELPWVLLKHNCRQVFFSSVVKKLPFFCWWIFQILTIQYWDSNWLILISNSLWIKCSGKFLSKDKTDCTLNEICLQSSTSKATTHPSHKQCSCAMSDTRDKQAATIFKSISMLSINCLMVSTKKQALFFSRDCRESCIE